MLLHLLELTNLRRQINERVTSSSTNRLLSIMVVVHNLILVATART